LSLIFLDEVEALCPPSASDSGAEVREGGSERGRAGGKEGRKEEGREGERARRREGGREGGRKKEGQPLELFNAPM